MSDPFDLDKLTFLTKERKEFVM
jgi:hypothetical protein